MKYIIMCGGQYDDWKTPRQLMQIMGETVVGRTIRLLREAGVDDIAISTNDERFEECGVPLLHHKNDFHGYTAYGGYWVDCFYPMVEPVCYIMGDVVFSPEAIQTIVSKETDEIEFFASAPPFDSRYTKEWAEPFAFKVQNTGVFWAAVNKLKKYQDCGFFARVPIAWELWQIIKGTTINHVVYTNYTVINDYTCDIDAPEDAAVIEQQIKGGESDG